MAFTEEDKFKIVFALCHSGKILLPNSTHFDSVFNDRLINLNIIIEEQALALVTKIEANKLSFEKSTTKDNVKQIGDIHLDTTRSLSNRRSELRRLLSELSNLLDIPNRCKLGGSGMSSVRQ